MNIEKRRICRSNQEMFNINEEQSGRPCCEFIKAIRLKEKVWKAIIEGFGDIASNERINDAIERGGWTDIKEEIISETKINVSLCGPTLRIYTAGRYGIKECKLMSMQLEYDTRAEVYYFTRTALKELLTHIKNIMMTIVSNSEKAVCAIEQYSVINTLKTESLIVFCGGNSEFIRKRLDAFIYDQGGVTTKFKVICGAPFAAIVKFHNEELKGVRIFKNTKSDFGRCWKIWLNSHGIPQDLNEAQANESLIVPKLNEAARGIKFAYFKDLCLKTLGFEYVSNQESKKFTKKIYDSEGDETELYVYVHAKHGKEDTTTIDPKSLQHLKDELVRGYKFNGDRSMIDAVDWKKIEIPNPLPPEIKKDPLEGVKFYQMAFPEDRDNSVVVVEKEGKYNLAKNKYNLTPLLSKWFTICKHSKEPPHKLCLGESNEDLIQDELYPIKKDGTLDLEHMIPEGMFFPYLPHLVLDD